MAATGPMGGLAPPRSAADLHQKQVAEAVKYF